MKLLSSMKRELEVLRIDSDQSALLADSRIELNLEKRIEKQSVERSLK